MSDLIEAASEHQETPSPATVPSPVDSYIPKCVVSIHAHPDDQEFSVAGTLAKWARAGADIISIVITNGDAGSNDPQYD